MGCPLALWNVRPRWEASYVVTPPDMQGPEGPGILSRARYELQGPCWGLEIPGSVSEEREERENHRPVIWLTLLRLTSRRAFKPGLSATRPGPPQPGVSEFPEHHSGSASVACCSGGPEGQAGHTLSRLLPLPSCLACSCLFSRHSRSPQRAAGQEPVAVCPLSPDTRPLAPCRCSGDCQWCWGLHLAGHRAQILG